MKQIVMHKLNLQGCFAKDFVGKPRENHATAAGRELLQVVLKEGHDCRAAAIIVGQRS
jgi:hypothetical protein